MNYYSNKFEKSVEGKLKNFLVQDGAEISAQQNAIWRARTSKYSAIFYNTGKFLIQGSDVSEISKKVEEFLGVSSSSSDVCARQNLSQNVPLKHIGATNQAKVIFSGLLLLQGCLLMSLT